VGVRLATGPFIWVVATLGRRAFFHGEFLQDSRRLPGRENQIGLILTRRRCRRAEYGRRVAIQLRGPNVWLSNSTTGFAERAARFIGDHSGGGAVRRKQAIRGPVRIGVERFGRCDSVSVRVEGMAGAAAIGGASTDQRRVFGIAKGVERWKSSFRGASKNSFRGD